MGIEKIQARIRGKQDHSSDANGDADMTIHNIISSPTSDVPVQVADGKIKVTGSVTSIYDSVAVKCFAPTAVISSPPNNYEVVPNNSGRFTAEVYAYAPSENNTGDANNKVVAFAHIDGSSDPDAWDPVQTVHFYAYE